MLTDAQKSALQAANNTISALTEQQLSDIQQKKLSAKQLSDTQLLEFLHLSNGLYRAGFPLISDTRYDFHFLPEWQRRHPNHPFLHNVEAEPVLTEKTLPLPVKMLSTEKAYSQDAIEKWLQRLQKAATDINLEAQPLKIRVTAKLDGFAAYDDGQRLYTRGDGLRGTDISRVLARGLIIGGDGKRAQGPGEIVVNRHYFAHHLSTDFDNSRNFQAAILAEKTVSKKVQKAIQDQAALFMPFSQLPHWQGTIQELLANFQPILENICHPDYETDGVVLEATDHTLKTYLGATRHHHRWQIAFKENKDSVQVRILNIIPQVSRTGRLNPVVEIVPTRLSGATISRVSAHHYSLVKNQSIGPDTVIELVRSGLVIPKIERVITPTTANIPTHCPECQTAVTWVGDYLLCPNRQTCPAQVIERLAHFFSTLGNIDGFGEKTLQKLHAHGIQSIGEIYQLKTSDLESYGFGPKQSQNLYQQLQRSRTQTVEDWRFLAAFGIVRMGKGNCERLLQHHRINDIFELTEETLSHIEHFSTHTAHSIIHGLQNIHKAFSELFSLDFNLQITPLMSELEARGNISSIHGKQLVFTGTMQSASRTEMESEARKLGAKIGKSISQKTDYLIVGEKAGASKLKNAEKKSVICLSEADYQQLIASHKT
jgi:DNA ligase (NAD+)